MPLRRTWLLRLALLGHLGGALMLILAGAMLPAMAIALHDEGPDAPGLIAAAGLTAAAGACLFLLTRGPARRTLVGHREGFLIVAVGWALAGLVGTLPYLLYAWLSPEGICAAAAGALRPIGVEFCSFTLSAFESVSGFTTTGATIIGDGLWAEYGLAADGRPGLPRGILFWRATTHFLGGMGIVVLGVAILPLLGVGGMQLFKAEVPGPTTDKLAPRVAETARLLWEVYLILSAVLFVLLMLGGMDAFEAACHSMSTMATGGFSTRAASVAGFQSGYLEWVLVVFMFLGGINFTLHWAARRGDVKPMLRDVEFRGYLGWVLVATALVCGALLFSGQGFAFFEALRVAAFQVVALVTTTGFASFDFELWTYAPVALLLVVLCSLSGAMAGSTSGGVKIVRHILLVKLWVRELFLLSHPRAVRPVRLGGRAVSPEVLRSAAAFIGVYLALVVLGTLYFALDGHDMLTAFTAAASSLGNVGPGLGEVGPYDNYAGLSPSGMWVSMALMILGRLEIYTVLVLFHPAFWRR